MLPKFRVWDKHKKQMIEWIDLDLSKDSGGDDITVFEPTGIVRDAFLMPILLQSTGLKDKNGVEIFEGDVVKHEPVPNPFFENNNFEIVQVRTGEWRIDSIRGGSVLAFHNHQVEIIGNKYQRPHLLEGDNE